MENVYIIQNPTNDLGMGRRGCKKKTKQNKRNKQKTLRKT